MLIFSQNTCQTLLSDRERDVLRFAASGVNPVRIADSLGISQNTVCKHLSNVRFKLNARNTTHAVALAISHDMINPL